MYSTVTRLLLDSSAQLILLSGSLPGRRLAARIWGWLPGRGSAIKFLRPLAKRCDSIGINYTALY